MYSPTNWVFIFKIDLKCRSEDVAFKQMSTIAVYSFGADIITGPNSGSLIFARITTKS